MLVAVTGGTGFIGSHTTAALVKAGHTVRLLVRDRGKTKRVFAAHGLAIDDCVVGDVRDAEVVKRLVRGCDAVFHAAAVVALEARRADEVRATNQRSVETVLAAALREATRRIVYVSSAGALFTPGGPPITSASPIGRAHTAYGESKARAEQYVRELQRDGAPIHTVYPTGVIGPDDPGLTEPNHAIQIMGKNGIRHLPVEDQNHNIIGMISLRHLLHEKVDMVIEELNAVDAYHNDALGG